MTASEAFVETLKGKGVTDCFGILGSAYMDALDLFPEAGIRFVSVQHEQNAAHMADGYYRVSGKTGLCIGQNGPGVTNCITGLLAATWANSPLVCVTPEAGTMGIGHGGFQECDQMAIFRKTVKEQYHVMNPARMAELTGRAFDTAQLAQGPVQLNIPRDYFYHTGDYAIPGPTELSLPAGNPDGIAAMAKEIAKARNPVILAGGGVGQGGAGAELIKLADAFGLPVATTFLHQDVYPCDRSWSLGPVGYNGSQAAMGALAEADVVIALGTRLGPFGTNPQYGIDYWPKKAKILQVELDPSRLGLTKAADVMVHGDVKLVAQSLHDVLQGLDGNHKDKALQKARAAKTAGHKAAWGKVRAEMEDTGDQGTPGVFMKPRQMLREMEKVLNETEGAVVSTDIGNVAAVANAYLHFKRPQSMLAPMTFGNCGYALPAVMGAKVADPSRPCIALAGDGAFGMSVPELMTCARENIPVTSVVFNNGQWGAEKKNQVIWFDDRYVGANLENPSYAEIAKSMKCEGIKVSHVDQVGDALKQALKLQKEGKPCVLEMMVTKELGDPFRRDAMKLPTRLLPQNQKYLSPSENLAGQPTDTTRN
jgi:sulfoacetaldehyde acetyltransferase